MSFYAWLMNQTARDDPVGDLARDALRDPTAPTTQTVAVWRRYLIHCPGACWQARAAMDQAAEEFSGSTRW